MTFKGLFWGGLIGGLLGFLGSFIYLTFFLKYSFSDIRGMANLSENFETLFYILIIALFLIMGMAIGDRLTKKPDKSVIEEIKDRKD